MITLKVINAEKARVALKAPQVSLGQEIYISHPQYAANLMNSNPGAFQVVAGELPAADAPVASEEESKEMRPKSNKMLTKAKASKYKSK